MSDRVAVKQETMRLSGQWPDRSLMWPGVSVLTRIRIGSVWHLAKIDARA